MTIIKRYVNWMFVKLKEIENIILPIVFCFCPIKKNKIVFTNFGGRGYGCNPKYIAQCIIDQKLQFDLVWLVKDMSAYFPKEIRKVPINDRFRSLYEMATAKILITNVNNDFFIVKKKEQYVIQTWHGARISKLLEREVEDKLNPKYVKESKRFSKQTDLLLSNSKSMTQCYKDAFWDDCEIMECGFPRNDIFFAEDKDITIKTIKQKLGISDKDKIVLYAPTFRDDGSKDAYMIDCKQIVKLLNSKGEKWRFLVRLHPNVTCDTELFPFGEDIINATSYPDMQELLLASDILITDYSSTVFEFAIMKKQVYIYAPDIMEYQKIRGLSAEFYKMPYPICKTNGELCFLLNEYTYQGAIENAEKFINIFGCYDDGNASNHVVERIKRKMM